jgi:hypothetical protein
VDTNANATRTARFAATTRVAARGCGPSSWSRSVRTDTARCLHSAGHSLIMLASTDRTAGRVSGRRGGEAAIYARLVRFSLVTGRWAVAQAIADDLAPEITSQPGCAGVTVFGDDNEGEYGIFVLGDSQEHAAAAAAIIRPVLDKHLSGTCRRRPRPAFMRSSPARPPAQHLEWSRASRR